MMLLRKFIVIILDPLYQREHLVIDCGDIIALMDYTDSCNIEEIPNDKFVTL